MATLIIRRILATIPVMLVVALIIFSLLYIAPGDPAVVIAGDRANPAEIEEMREALGLNQPYFVRFVEWLLDVARGDLGRSVFTGTPVTTLMLQRAEPTLSLMVLTLLLSTSIGIPLGVIAAWKANSWLDRLIGGISVLGFSVPVFVTGYALAYVFSRHLQWFPVQGYRPLSSGILPWFHHLVLPALALSSIYVALIARITRSTMLDVLGQDFIRTARAKGVAQKDILFGHALRNAAVPIVTVVGIGMALLIGGTVVTESVFALPGIGRLTLDAIMQRDYPIIQGVVLVFSMIYVMVNLLIDLLYSVLDPRIKY